MDIVGQFLIDCEFDMQTKLGKLIFYGYGNFVGMFGNYFSLVWKFFCGYYFSWVWKFFCVYYFSWVWKFLTGIIFHAYMLESLLNDFMEMKDFFLVDWGIVRKL